MKNMWYFTISVFTILIIIIVLIRFKNGRKRILANQIPGPSGNFLVGSLSVFLQGPEKSLINMRKLYKMYEKCMFKLWLCNNLYIVLTQPEDIKFVLTNPKLYNKSREYKVLNESIMGQGIFLTDDFPKWKNNRRIVTKGLNFSTVKSFIPIFYEEAVVLDEILKKNCNSKKECDISGFVNLATMEMIGKTAFGVTFNAQKGGKNKFVTNLQTVMNIWEYRIAHPWYLYKTLFRFSLVKRKHDKSEEIINKFTENIINDKITELRQNHMNVENKAAETNGDEDIIQKPKTVLEILLDHKMSHNQLQDELVTIMIGGQETTAMANACTIFMLAHHQDVQNKVFQELQSIFDVGVRDRPPTYDDLQQMEYLERVIKETMRLFPSVPIICRRLDEEMQIGNYMCPAGSSLVISPMYLHSSSQYYADPENFNPDNFTPDACNSRHPTTYIPFSTGNRNCIGIKYAMVQMKTVISTLVRRNKFFPSDRNPTPKNLRLMFTITLKFVDGCHVKVEPRI